MKEPLEKLILEQIRSQGPLGFDTFMELALYHPDHGYYSRGPRVGWRGDYLTSPELDPGFGLLWSRAVEDVWELCGRPDAFNLIEIGAGEGGFAAALLDATGQGLLKEVVRYLIVEPLPSLRTRQEQRLTRHAVTWVGSPAEIVPGPGCLIGHEVLDNVPVKLLSGTSEGTVELLVDENAGMLRFVAGPTLDVDLEPGHQREVAPLRDDLVAEAAAAISKGALFWVDYGVRDGRWDEYPDGTLVCYSDTGTDTEPLARPGHKDITSHVDWRAVAEALTRAGATPAGPVSQREVLRALGVDGLQQELKAEYDRALTSGEGAAALRALSRRQALAALTDPGGLGGFDVMTGAIDIPVPTAFSPKRDSAGPEGPADR